MNDRAHALLDSITGARYRDAFYAAEQRRRESVRMWWLNFADAWLHIGAARKNGQ